MGASLIGMSVTIIQDLLRTDRRFLSHAEFVRKYHLHYNFVARMQVVSAIPQSLIDRANHPFFQ